MRKLIKFIIIGLAMAIMPYSLNANTCPSATVTVTCKAIGPYKCYGTNPNPVTVPGVSWQGKGCIWQGEFNFNVGKAGGNALAECDPSKRITAVSNKKNFQGNFNVNVSLKGVNNGGYNSGRASCMYKFVTSGPY